MRFLTFLAVIAALAWGGYWFVGSRALDRAIDAVVAASPEISTAGHSIMGFPNRFDVTFNAPRIETGGLRWEAPFVQVFALTYRPNHLLAVFAHDQRLVALGQDVAIHSDDLRASLVMEAGLDLPVDRFTLVGLQLGLSTHGAHHQIDTLRAASRRLSDTVHEVALVMETVIPDPALMGRLDPAAIWPRRFDVLRLDGEVTLDRPLDRHSLDGPAPRIESLALTGARAAFEDVTIVLTGRLVPDAGGLLSGDLGVSVTGLRALMPRLRAMGLMPDAHDSLAARALEGLVRADDPDTLEAAFVVERGVVRLGPLSVGHLPPIF
ncbi:MAG: DUF2125 domain-containing protein [Pararhodobacter sp.]